MSTFDKYSAYYDLLYRDKDYAAEAAYVASAIRSRMPRARHLLEFGSGTGRHGRLLARHGFEVYGIERSAEMVAIAQSASAGFDHPGSFTCMVGDICEARLGRTFDAVIALFHVVSYQTTNRALRQTFDAASRHLHTGGFFVFDVWHGPAVLMQEPSSRVKEVTDDRHSVRRTARPELDTNRSTVNVIYDVRCEDKVSGSVAQFREEHLMRYVFPTEVDFLAHESALRVVASEEFLTSRATSPETWGVMYVLQK